MNRVQSDTEIVSDQERLARALTNLCPESMRETFTPMVLMAVSFVPADSVSAMINDLESAYDENGDVDIQKLIAVGKQFGLTDEAIQGYQLSFASAEIQAPY